MNHKDDIVEGRRGMWMHTSLGGRFWPGDPRPEEVFMSDIANGLAMTCRFNGQCEGFYSVAQHSVLVADAVRDFRYPGCDGKRDWERRLPAAYPIALLHDSAEAYISDVGRPVNRARRLHARRWGRWWRRWRRIRRITGSRR